MSLLQKTLKSCSRHDWSTGTIKSATFCYVTESDWQIWMRSELALYGFMLFKLLSRTIKIQTAILPSHQIVRQLPLLKERTLTLSISTEQVASATCSMMAHVIPNLLADKVDLNRDFVCSIGNIFSLDKSTFSPGMGIRVAVHSLGGSVPLQFSLCYMRMERAFPIWWISSARSTKGPYRETPWHTWVQSDDAPVQREG